MAVINIVEYDAGGVEIWADVPGADMEGIIVGLGPTRQEAITDAVRCLEALVEQLQSPLELWATDDTKYYNRRDRSRRTFTVNGHRFAGDV